MELGGGEMSLLGLLAALDPAKVDVDLFLCSHSGPLMRFIPEYVNILPSVDGYSNILNPLKDAFKAGQLRVVAGRLIAKWKHRRYRKAHPAHKADQTIFQILWDCVMPSLPKINPEQEYDLCISYMNPHNNKKKKVNARKKLAWIHTDYSQIETIPERELPVWGAYDYIAAISPDVKNAFIHVFPTLTSKVIDIENIIPENYIIARSKDQSTAYLEMQEGSVKLLSIGRFCEAKNYDNVPYIAKRIVESGLTDLKWYIIGYGGDEELIRRKIAEAKMERHVILLGKKDNPYPYIKACDIHVQPSRYEGKSITVREAQILGKPVVVTNYPTAHSQINDKTDGIIVPLENEGCAAGITNFIKNTKLQRQIVQNIARQDFAGPSEVIKIYSILNNSQS